MLVKSLGCPLHTIKYRESGLIVYAYTRNFGFQALVIQGIRNRKGAGASSIYQPMFLLDIDFYFNQKQDMHRIKEARIHMAYQTIPFNIYKSSMVLFLAEILYKCLKTQETAPGMFDFISNAMQILDQLDEGISNFHLLFLMKLSRYLGFYPNTSETEGLVCFDLRDGIFRVFYPDHPYYIPEKYAHVFLKLLEMDFNTLDQLQLSQVDRNILIEHIIDFYRLHQENLKHVHSFKIFKRLFQE